MTTSDAEEQSHNMGRVPETTPDDALDIFQSRDDVAEPLTSSEIADRLGCSRRTAHRHLTTLEDRGDVTAKEVGAQAKVWWVPIAAAVDAGGGDRSDD